MIAPRLLTKEELERIARDYEATIPGDLHRLLGHIAALEARLQRTEQVAEDVRTLQMAWWSDCDEDCDGDKHATGCEVAGYEAALSRLAAKAQGYDEMRAINARLALRTSNQEEAISSLHEQLGAMQRERDAAVADNAALVRDMKRAHVAAMSMKEIPGRLPEVWEATEKAWLPHPGTELLERHRSEVEALKADNAALVDDLRAMHRVAQDSMPHAERERIRFEILERMERPHPGTALLEEHTRRKSEAEVAGAQLMGMGLGVHAGMSLGDAAIDVANAHRKSGAAIADVLSAARGYSDKPHQLYSAVRRLAVYCATGDDRDAVEQGMDMAYDHYDRHRKALIRARNEGLEMAAEAFHSTPTIAARIRAMQEPEQ